MKQIEKFYKLYKDDVYRYLLSLTHNPTLSEDLLGDTFVNAISSISKFKGKSCVKIMKSRKKSFLKILSGTVAVVLIIGILFITNSFVGNPISTVLAKNKIEKYIDKNYSDLNLEMGKVSYNFKDSSYMSYVKSKNSIDTRFAIYYRDGKVQRDDYKSYVLSMFNTMDRLSDEYSFIVKKLVAEELGYEDNTTMVQYSKDAYGESENILELDMKFDKNLPLNAEVTVRVDLENGSLENAANILIDAHKVFVENGCKFSEYSFFAESGRAYIMIDNVIPTQIENE